MRIAYVTDSWYPNVNGVITSMEAFKREHEREGHEVFIFCPRYFGKDEMGPTVYRSPSVPYPFKMMREQRVVFPVMRVLRKIRDLDIDIIHTQSPGFATIGAILASRLWRIPHIHSFHTHFMRYMHYAPFPRPLARAGILWIARRVCGRATRVVTPGTGMRDILLSYGVDSPIEVLPTGAPIEPDAKPSSWSELFERYRLGSPSVLSGKSVLSFAGRIGPEKNRVSDRESGSAPQSRDDFHFVLIGDGPYRSQIERTIEARGLGGYVTLTGYVSHKDAMELIRLSDLLICASLTETQGMVILEAMTVGTPVVAVHAMGIDDMIGDGVGGITTPNDPSAFARSVSGLLSDRNLLRQKSREALQRADQYSMKNQADRMIQIYREAIDEFRRHGVPRYRRHIRF